MFPQRAMLIASGPAPNRLALRNLPAFSPVAAKLITMLRQDQVSFKEAAELIKSDAGISVELLRLANSAITGVRFPATNILHALSILGVKQVASLITTLFMGKLLKPVSKLPLMRRCWRHNLATALVARRQAETFGVDSESGYMFGLLAGIGRLGLLVSEPEAYSELAARSDAEGIPLDLLELEYYGFDNRQVGAQLVADWRLPQELLQIFSTTGNGSVALLVAGASEEADRLGFGVVELGLCNSTDSEFFEVAEGVNRIEQELGI